MKFKFRVKQTVNTFQRKIERVKTKGKMERSRTVVTLHLILKKIIHYVWLAFSLLVRRIMVWSYGEKGESMPPITDLLILDSASSLATKIRTRKVSTYSYGTDSIDGFLNPRKT